MYTQEYTIIILQTFMEFYLIPACESKLEADLSNICMQSTVSGHVEKSKIEATLP